jgi:beta-lactamase superfamily II metal-dependent hydrolase
VLPRELDLLVAAGARGTHIGALPELLERYRVHQAVLTGAASGQAAYRQLARTLITQSVPRVDAADLPAFDLGDGVVLRVLADTPDGTVLRPERPTTTIAARPDY